MTPSSARTPGSYDKKAALESLRDTFKNATHDIEHRAFTIRMSPEFRIMVMDQIDDHIKACNAHDELVAALKEAVDKIRSNHVDVQDCLETAEDLEQALKSAGEV